MAKQDDGLLAPVDFNIGTNDQPALMTYSPITKQTHVSDEAKVLIKKWMILLSFVYTGRGTQKGLLIHSWRAWHAHSGMYDEDDKPADARLSAEAAMKRLVKQYSDQFFAHGICTDGPEFCVVDGKPASKKESEKREVRFAGWAFVQAAHDDWDGELVVPDDALCFEHLKMTLQYSSIVNQYDKAEFQQVLNAWKGAEAELAVLGHRS